MNKYFEKLTANYIKAKENLKIEIPQLQKLIQQNSDKRKKIKLKKKIEADPVLKIKNLVDKQINRDKKRFNEKGKIGLSNREVDLNTQQRLLIKEANELINENPNAILKDKNLLEKISWRVDGEGNLYKSKPDLTKVLDSKSNSRFFHLSHGRRAQLGTELTDAPVNRFVAPFSTNNEFIKDAETFIEKNPDHPKVKDILKKAEKLKITLRPDVPLGTFKNTKGNPVRYVGYTENINDPVGKIKTVIDEYMPKELKPKFNVPASKSGTELLSFPANLKNLKNVRGKGTLIGAALEGLFYSLDWRNEMSKGKNEAEAKAQALSNLTFGLYKNKEYMKDLKKVAEEQGIDSRAFDKVYALNDMVGKIDSQKNYYKEKIEAAKKIKTTNQEEVNKKNEVIKGLEKASASFNKSSQGMIERNIEKVAGQVSISKAGEMFPTPNLDQIADARSNITQKDFSEPFTNLRNTAFDKLKKEKTRAFDVQSRQFDTEAGSIGNLLNTRLMTLDAPGRTKEQEYINEMAKNYPQELYRYNLARGVDPDNPVTGEAYQILKAKYSGLGLAEGGLAGLMKKYYD